MEMNLVCSNKWAKIEKDPMTKDREFFSSIYIYKCGTLPRTQSPSNNKTVSLHNTLTHFNLLPCPKYPPSLPPDASFKIHPRVTNITSKHPSVRPSAGRGGGKSSGLLNDIYTKRRLLLLRKTLESNQITKETPNKTQFLNPC